MKAMIYTSLALMCIEYLLLPADPPIDRIDTLTLLFFFCGMNYHLLAWMRGKWRLYVASKSKA